VGKRLTAIGVQKVRPGPERREISDGGSGLYLIVQPLPTGSKSWALRYRLNGVPAKLTLGGFPALSLAAARKLAAEAQHELAQGNNPKQAREDAKLKAAAAKADTVTAVCEEYLVREGRKLRTFDQRVSILRRHVYPQVGDRPIESLKRSDIVRILDKIEDNAGQRMADVTLSVLRRIFNWHSLRSDTFIPPIVPGMGRQNVNEHRRSRILDDSELRATWLAATAEGGPFGALIRFLLLTAARRGEAANLRWDEVDANGVWTLPAAKSKTKADVVRPLSGAALAILGELPHVGDCPFVFTANGLTPINSFSEPKQELDAASGVNGWVVHDLRRTARTLLSRCGVSVDVSERCLGHVMPVIRATYDKHRFLNEMRAALEALAGEIERVVHPPEGNVVLLARGRG
jgi:integrase